MASLAPLWGSLRVGLKTDDHLRAGVDMEAQVHSWCCSPQLSSGDELTPHVPSGCLQCIWSPCHMFNWRWVPNITSSWVYALESTNCNPAHLIATAHSAFWCLFVSANKMFSFWYSKPAYGTPVTTGFLRPVNLELIVFLQPKYPLPLRQENYVVWNNFHFCHYNISFSSL